MKSSEDSAEDNLQKMESSRTIIKSFKAKANENRTVSEKIADIATGAFGSIPFLIINVVWFLGWIAINLSLMPGIKAFDPFPFGLLTMIVSLEAIMLAILVLISQNRAAKIDDIREEIDLQVDVTSEQEITKALELLTLLLKKNGINVASDKILSQMLQPISTEKIEKTLEKQIG